MNLRTSSFTNTVCGKASINIPAGSVCPCPDGKYSTGPLSCTFCHNNCGLCYGPSNADCYYNAINANLGIRSAEIHAHLVLLNVSLVMTMQ